MSARSLALANGAIVAMLAAPAAAEECGDYRAGFVLSEAASRASGEHSARVAEDMPQCDGRHRPDYGEAELRAHLDDNALRAAAETAASGIATAMRFKAEHPHRAGDT